MKHKLKILFLILIVLPIVAIFTIVPLYIERNEVQDKILTLLKEKVPYDLEGAYIRWRWLPSPHLSVRNAQISTKYIDLTLPQTDLYPDWVSTFHKKEYITKNITYINPLIHLKSLPQKKKKAEHFLYPVPQISIRNGTLKIDAQNLPVFFRKKAITLAGLNSEIDYGKDNISLTVESRSDFCKKISADGQFNIKDLTYKLNIDAQDLKIHKTITSLIEGKIVPVESQANLKGSVEGKGLQKITGKMIGILPCFTIKPTDKKILLNCGFVDFNFKKDGSDFSINVNELELKEPSFRLQGAIRRAASSSNRTPPVWNIDIKASELNMDQIRSAALTLWGGNKVTQQVCNIVRGGKAKSAQYVFNGPASEFKILEKLDLQVDILSAPIYVPKPDLNLKNTSGPIKIKDGYLSGKGLRAELTNSKGSNGTLLIDLCKRDKTFTLEMDIDSKLGDLPSVLEKVVPDDNFQNELTKFHVFDGKAKSHLKIGDSLDDIKVYLQVHEMRATFYYDRLDELIEVENGRFTLEPFKASWDDITAKFDGHYIYNTNGLVSWKDTPWIIIDRLEAHVDADRLHKKLLTIPAIQNDIRHAVNTLNGKLYLNQGSAEGPAAKPLEWRYTANLSGNNISMTSPLLPDTTRSEKLSIVLDHKNVKINQLNAKILDSTLKLNGNLQHDKFENWRGWVNLNGTVNKKLGNWSKTKQHFPNGLNPKAPFTYRNFTVTKSPEGTEFTGNILAGSGTAQFPRITLDAATSLDAFKIRDLQIIGEDESATITYDSLDPRPETFLLTWNGEISSETTQKLLDNDKLLQEGQMIGNCRLVMSSEPEKSIFEGNFNATNLQLPFGSDTGKPITIRSLDFSGKGKSLEIEDFDVKFGEKESFVSFGTVTLDKSNMVLDLYLTSPFLTHETITKLQSDFKKDRSPNDIKTNHSPFLSGNIKFNVFQYNIATPDNDETDSKKHTYYLNPFQGVINIFPDKGISLEIETAQTCCLDFTGIYYSDNELGESSFTIQPHCEPLPLLQGTLPCLGIEQNLIEGPFRVKVDLTGKPDSWKKGLVEIHSDGGRILRMDLLAKILKVVNLTDLFRDNSKNGKPNKKGFAFKKLEFEADIENNILIIRKAIIYGEGLNILARGKMNLSTMDADFTVLVAPLKSLDKLISWLPIIGRIIAGKDKTVVAIPVSVKGNIKDPEIKTLPKSAIGDAFANMIKGTLKIPYTIISPILPKKNDK